MLAWLKIWVKAFGFNILFLATYFTDQYTSHRLLPMHNTIICKSTDKTDRGISLLPTSYDILTNIFIVMLTTYVDKIIVANQGGFSVTDQLLIRFVCIHQVPHKKWESNEAGHQLSIAFNKPMI